MGTHAQRRDDEDPYPRVVTWATRLDWLAHRR